MTHPLTRILLVSNIGVGLVCSGLLVAAIFPWVEDGPSGTAPAPMRTRGINEPKPIVFVAAREQPVFTPSRTLPAESEVADGENASTPSSTPAPQLVGIMRMGRGRSLVLVKDPSTGKQEIVTVGEVLNGWRVLRVERRRVMMEQGAEQMTLELLPPEQDAQAASQNPAQAAPGVTSSVAAMSPVPGASTAEAAMPQTAPQPSPISTPTDDATAQP